MIRITMNLIDVSNGILGLRAVQYLIDKPEKADVLLEYGDNILFYAKRNKASISVWEQPW